MKNNEISELKKFVLGMMVDFASNTVSEEEIDARYFHSIRVANIAKQIAKEISLNEETIDLVYFASICHDIAKLNNDSLKHGFTAVKLIRRYAFNLPESLKNYIGDKSVREAILFHSEKFCDYGNEIEDNIILNILKDADMIDKLCYDALTKCISNCDSLIDKLDKLYCKREHILSYKPCTVPGMKKIKHGLEQLNFFIDQLELCKVN